MEGFQDRCQMWLSKCDLLRESRAPASWDWPLKCETDESRDFRKEKKCFFAGHLSHLRIEA